MCNRCDGSHIRKSNLDHDVNQNIYCSMTYQSDTQNGNCQICTDVGNWKKMEAAITSLYNNHKQSYVLSIKCTHYSHPYMLHHQSQDS